MAYVCGSRKKKKKHCVEHIYVHSNAFFRFIFLTVFGNCWHLKGKKDRVFSRANRIVKWRRRIHLIGRNNDGISKLICPKINKIPPGENYVMMWHARNVMMCPIHHKIKYETIELGNVGFDCEFDFSVWQKRWSPNICKIVVINLKQL